MIDNITQTKINQNFTLNNNHIGKRLDVIIADLFPEYSRSQIQKWIKDGSITVNNEKQKPKYTALGYENIQLLVELIPTNEWIAEDIKLDIVFEDDDIIVINKPNNMVVHPGAGNTHGTISNALLNHNECFKLIPRAGIVHRLDKDTTGLMVAAKTTLAYNSLVKQLSSRSVNRRYLAIVQGLVYEDGKIDKPIGRCANNRIKMAINFNGKEAITNYFVLENYENHTLVECKLETGRTHQIRVHMKSINNPLVGDKTYNKGNKNFSNLSKQLNQSINNFPRQALHAYKLSFIHPRKNELVSFTTNLPNDMLNLIDELKENM